MSTDKSKTFTNTEKAEKYFADCVRELMPKKESGLTEFENALADVCRG
jgi:hypothetical protein